MSKARNLADLLDANGDVKADGLDNVPPFENIVDTGTEGTKIAVGTTAQRGNTAGQLRFNSTTGLPSITLVLLLSLLTHHQQFQAWEMEILVKKILQVDTRYL